MIILSNAICIILFEYCGIGERMRPQYANFLLERGAMNTEIKRQTECKDIQKAKTFWRKSLHGVALFLVFMLSLPLFCCGSSCSAEQIVREMCSSCGIEAAIYLSSAEEGAAGYLPGLTLTELLDGELPSGVEYALALHSRLDSVYELGAFVCADGGVATEVGDLVRGRLVFLDTVCTVGESFLFIKGNYVVYGFMPDVAIARSVAEDMLP